MESEIQAETVYYITPSEQEIAANYILKDDSEVVKNAEITEDISNCDGTVDRNNESNESEFRSEASSSREISKIDRLTCKYCCKKFTKITNKQRHVRRVHNVKRETGTHIRCIECNITFYHIYRLREHLETAHKLNMSEEELHFPNMTAFKKWKCEIERKTLCSYTLRHGARRGPEGPRYFYACHRSGKYYSKVRGPRQRMLKTQGTCKMGIVCTASIFCEENSRDVLVRYCPHHYGHGRETTLIQLSPEEQTAIAASVSKGIPFENLLDEIRDGQSSKDHFQLHLLKKKDIRSINNAYNCEEYNTEISDSESVNRWVNLCCEMENSPVLFYKQEEVITANGNHEEFLLVIMTEFQKHILLSSSKDVICVDSLYRKKGGRFYLTILFIMDENDLAFPVAFCISNKVDKAVISQFFHSICQSTGPLSAKYFMSDSESFYYESWKEVMKDDSKWLWSMWYVDNRIRVQLRIFRGNTEKRADVYKTMRVLLECPNPTVFTCMLENFIESLLNDTHTRDLGNFIRHNYACNPEIWACCYRKDIDLSTNIHLEIMHRTFKYCCRVGRKKRLDKFIFVLMKLIRDKMLDRLSNMLDEERINLAIDTINMCHTMGLEILPGNITILSDKIWLIKSENDAENFYVTQECKTCPEHCNLRCAECDICVHMYTCTCLHNLINANLCQHIHSVVWNLLTPRFSLPSSPLHYDEEPSGSSSRELRDECSRLLRSVLRKTHDVYKMIQGNKCNLSKAALNGLMAKMDECADICSGKKVKEDNHREIQKPLNINPNTVLVLNPVLKNNSNISFLVPNQLSTNPANNAMSQCVLLIPNQPKTS